MYANIILNDYTSYKNDQDNDYNPDSNESEKAAEFCKESLFENCLLYGYYAEKDEEAGLLYYLKSIEDEANDDRY